MGLIEHKIKEPKAQKIVNIMFPHWHSANNFAQAPLGRILLCWDPLILAIQVLHSQVNLSIVMCLLVMEVLIL